MGAVPRPRGPCTDTHARRTWLDKKQACRLLTKQNARGQFKQGQNVMSYRTFAPPPGRRCPSLLLPGNTKRFFFVVSFQSHFAKSKLHACIWTHCPRDQPFVVSHKALLLLPVTAQPVVGSSQPTWFFVRRKPGFIFRGGTFSPQTEG